MKGGKLFLSDLPQDLAVEIKEKSYIGERDWIEERVVSNAAMAHINSKRTGSEKLWFNIGTILVLLLCFVLVYFEPTTSNQIIIANNTKSDQKTGNYINKVHDLVLNKLGSPSSKISVREKSLERKSDNYCSGLGFGFSIDGPFVCFGSLRVILGSIGETQVDPTLFTSELTNTLIGFILFYCSPPAPIPSVVFDITGLQALVIADPGSSFVPSDINRLPNLNILVLVRGYSQSTGTIPSELGIGLTHLEDFGLYDNHFTGTFPSEIANLPILREIDVSGNLLSGQIPSEIGVISTLQRFALSGNFMTGQVPSQLGKLSNLGDLWIGINQFSGPLPSELGLLTALSVLHAPSNNFTGTLPKQFSKLYNLTDLDLSYNQFSGTIPSQLALLQFTAIDFSENQFSGYIPPQLLNIPNINIACINSGLLDPRCNPNQDDTFVSSSVTTAIIVVAGFLMLIIFLIGIVLIIFRKHQLIKQNVIEFEICCLFGFFLIVSSIIPFGLTLSNQTSGSKRDIECALFPELLFNGLEIIFSSILIRNYPVWRASVHSSISRSNPSVIVATEKLTVDIKTRIKRMQFFISLIVSFLIGFAVVTAYSVQSKHIPEKPGCDIDSKVSLPLVSLMTVYLFLLLIGACITTIQINTVSAQFNDIKQIGKALYNLLTFGIAMVILGLVTNAPQLLFLCISLSIIFTSIMFLFVVFVPNLKNIYKNKGADVHAEPSTSGNKKHVTDCMVVTH